MATERGPEPAHELRLAAAIAKLFDLLATPAVQAAFTGSAGAGIGTTEGRILWSLARRGPTRPTVLTERLGVGAPSISKATAKLERRGLLEWERGADDRRVKLLTLTERGRKATAEIYQAGDAMMRAVTGDWTQDEALAFTERMERFVQATTDYTDSLRRRPGGT